MEIIKQFQAIFNQQESAKVSPKPSTAKPLILSPDNVMKCMQVVLYSDYKPELVNRAAHFLVTLKSTKNLDGKPSGFMFNETTNFAVNIENKVRYFRYFQIETSSGSAGFYVEDEERWLGKTYKSIPNLRPQLINSIGISLSVAVATLSYFCYRCRKILGDDGLQLNKLESLLDDPELDSLLRENIEAEIAAINTNNTKRYLDTSARERKTQSMRVVMRIKDLLPGKQESTLSRILKAVGA